MMAECGLTRSSATGCFDRQNATIAFFSAEAVLGCLSFFCCDHFDESESARFLGVWIDHDVDSFNCAVFAEHFLQLFLGQSGSNTTDKEVRSFVF